MSGYYSILGLRMNASLDDIQQAFEQQLPNASNEQQQAIATSYEVLKNTDSRFNYDYWLSIRYYLGQRVDALSSGCVVFPFLAFSVIVHSVECIVKFNLVKSVFSYWRDDLLQGEFYLNDVSGIDEQPGNLRFTVSFSNAVTPICIQSPSSNVKSSLLLLLSKPSALSLVVDDAVLPPPSLHQGPLSVDDNLSYSILGKFALLIFSDSSLKHLVKLIPINDQLKFQSNSGLTFKLRHSTGENLFSLLTTDQCDTWKHCLQNLILNNASASFQRLPPLSMPDIQAIWDNDPQLESQIQHLEFTPSNSVSSIESSSDKNVLLMELEHIDELIASYEANIGHLLEKKRKLLQNLHSSANALNKTAFQIAKTLAISIPAFLL